MEQFFNKMFNDPLFHIGTGLLSTNNFGEGLQQGMLSYQGNRRANQMRRYEQMRMAEMQRKAEQEREAQRQAQEQAAMRQQVIAQRYPDLAGLPPSWQDAAFKEQIKSPNGELVKAVVNGVAQWVPRSQAAGLPIVPTAPLVDMGNTRSLADEIALATIKDDASYYRGQAEGADKAIASSRQGLNLMKQGATGRWEPVKGAAAAWAGIDPTAAATYDMWRDYATAQALDTLQQFKGPTTDFEFGVARSLAVQQGKSDFANFVALKAQERAARRTRAKRSAYSEWVSKHRQKYPDFEQWFEEKKNPYPAWDLADFEKEYRAFRGTEGVERRNQGYLK